MRQYEVRVHSSQADLPRSEQFAWKVAADAVPVDQDIAEMIGNRIIDNAAVAAASLKRRPISSAHSQALAHPRGDSVRSFQGRGGLS
jgi:2-methylcitrate dehydratase